MLGLKAVAIGTSDIDRKKFKYWRFCIVPAKLTDIEDKSKLRVALEQDSLGQGTDMPNQ